MSKSQNALCTCLLLALAAACKSSPPAEPATSEPPVRPGQEEVTAEQQLGEDAQKLTLADQRKAFLFEQHMANAKNLMSGLRLDDARTEVDAALELQPDSLSAKNLRAQILSLKGEPSASTQTITEEMNQQYALRVQQMKAEAQDSLRKAKLMIARNDYQGAIAELEIANNLIRFAPYSVNWEGLDVEAKQLLENARRSRETASEASQQAQQRKAYEQLQAEEAANRDRKQALIDSMLARAIAEFEAGHYDQAEEIAKQVLEKDPRAERAIEIRDAAFRAGRTKVREDYVLQKKEQFRKWNESMREIQIPYNDVITEPDPVRWNQITAMRAKRSGIDIGQKMSETEQALHEQLRTTPVQLPGVKDMESLSKVIDLIRTQTGLPLVVDPAADAAVTSAGIVFNFSFENKLTVEQALHLIVSMTGDIVTYTIRHDTILITTKEKARNKPIIVNHDVQDLIFGLTDFIGPRINKLRLLDKMTDEDGAGPFGGIGEKPKLIEPGELATLIQENVAVGTWQDQGVSIEAGTGYVLITHTPEVQEQVRQFLEDLRRFSSSLVTIESKFLTVAKNWLQEIGVDLRGLDNHNVNDVTNGLEDMASLGLDNGGTGPVTNAAGHPSAGVFYDAGKGGELLATTQNFFGTPLGNAVTSIGGATFQLTILKQFDLSAILRAVEKSQDIQLVNDQQLSVHNTQRAYVAVINQMAYIQDFDVQVAQFQAVADPQINVLNEGVVLDVRPTIHHDRKYLTLEIQPTVAKVVALRNYSSTLGGNTSPVSFQLPEVQVQSVFTTALIPDGGSIMLGGLSNVRNIERRAEIPWVAKIPIIGFFFKNEGYNDENRSLMILIRARITDVHDEMKKLEAAR
jgi:type II secretory pathway component GspD/PulD (secretin)